jgi:hypothetical protein
LPHSIAQRKSVYRIADIRCRLLKHNFKRSGAVREMTLMSDNPLEKIERLESLAAWHRINAERAGADWVWEARLRTAEDLERQAAKIRAQLPDDPATTQS